MGFQRFCVQDKGISIEILIIYSLCYVNLKNERRNNKHDNFVTIGRIIFDDHPVRLNSISKIYINIFTNIPHDKIYLKNTTLS